jgi:hypothetical protein
MRVRAQETYTPMIFPIIKSHVWTLLISFPAYLIRKESQLVTPL